jgi:hypothetical protein
VSVQDRRPPQIGGVVDRARQVVDRLAREAPTIATVLVGRDPPVAWRYPSQRRAATAATVIGVALVAIAALLAFQLFTVYRPPPLLELSLALGPLFLVARYPLMAWRIGVVAAVLVSFDSRIHVEVQAVALGVVFCLAGLRQAGPVRWWMYAFTLVPAKLLLHGPVKVIGAMVGLGVVTVALDGLASTRRARRALARPSSSRRAGQYCRSGRASPGRCTTSLPTTCR